MKHFIYILLASTLLASCSGLLKNEVVVDNPTDSEVSVTIGEQTVELGAYDRQSIELENGEYTVVATVDGETTIDESMSIESDGILNPTLTKYVKWTDLYVESYNYDTYSHHLNDDIIELDGYEYYGDFTIYTDAWIEEDWDYGLDDYWPDEITLTGDYTLKSKVYSADDFIDDYDNW